jgi:hypothetical protein
LRAVQEDRIGAVTSDLEVAIVEHC